MARFRRYRPWPRAVVRRPNFDLMQKILKQLEYYFSEMNLSRDKFLQRQLESGNGWVGIDVLLTFNKIRSLTGDDYVVSQAVDRLYSPILELSDDGMKVRRRPSRPLPARSEERRKELDEMTVFVKGFPLDTCTDELVEYFGQFGRCVDVLMRRHHRTRKFRGSVFATFETKEEASAFLARDSVKFNELELTRSKKTRPAIRVKKDAEDEALAASTEELKIVPGCLLRVTELDKVTTWKSLREALAPYATVAFVDYSVSKGEAVLRFIEEGSAYAVLAKLEEQGKGLNVDGNRVIAEALEAGEEIEYWKKLAAIKRKLRNRRGRHRSRSVQRGKKRRSEERSISPANMME